MAFVSASCGGEVCSICGEYATHKVEEHIFSDDPRPDRHELTAYICDKHFTRIMNRTGYMDVEQPEL